MVRKNVKVLFFQCCCFSKRNKGSSTDSGTQVEVSSRSRKAKGSRYQALLTTGDPDDEPDLPNSWIWRILRAALPFQLALVALFCAACLLEPHCCEATNGLNLSLTPQLRYVRGPPPVWSDLVGTPFVVFFLIVSPGNNYIRRVIDDQLTIDKSCTLIQFLLFEIFRLCLGKCWQLKCVFRKWKIIYIRVIVDLQWCWYIKMRIGIYKTKCIYY